MTSNTIKMNPVSAMLHALIGQTEATPLSRIAFQSCRSGKCQIYSMNPFGGDMGVLTSEGENTSPDWSPDGSQIAFVSDRDGASEIYVMRSDGSRQTRLTWHEGVDAEPAWSPDGSQIAFSSARGGGDSRLFVMRSDGSEAHAMTEGDGADKMPDWSPDGRYLLFVRHSSDASAIHLLEILTGNVTQITPWGDYHSATWSPDGEKIAYVRNGNLFTMNPNGEETFQVTTGSQAKSAASWSPDSRYLVYSSSSRNSALELYRVRASDGMLRRRLTLPQSFDQNPVWSPMAQ